MNDLFSKIYHYFIKWLAKIPTIIEMLCMTRLVSKTGIMNNSLIIITSTWNSVDFVIPFLNHVFQCGADLVVVTDMGSDDGTVEALTDIRWQGRVRVSIAQELKNLDSTNDSLAIVKKDFGGGWCIACDPDEFIMTTGGNLKRTIERLENEGVLSASIPRYNMTALRSVAEAGLIQGDFRKQLKYRIIKRHRRTPDEYFQEILTPPWIYTHVMDKVIFRIESAIRIGDGDHCVEMMAKGKQIQDHGLYMLHYPMRSYGQFEKKIHLAKKDFEANPHWHPHIGWQLRRWIKILEKNLLHDEYMCQFIPDDEIHQLIEAGLVDEEKNI
jgi:hypothetical protein